MKDFPYELQEKILKDPENFVAYCESMKCDKDMRNVIAKDMVRRYQINYRDPKCLVYLDLESAGEDEIRRFVDITDYYRDGKVNYYRLVKERYLPLYLLTVLNCSESGLTSVPELPNMEEFYCAKNKLRTLPQFVPKLTSLDCGYNQLTRLPFMPEVTSLSCGYNQLARLPPLPKVQTLLCWHNRLKSLPQQLPEVETLNCKDNLLTDLPTMPKVTVLICNNNRLMSMPPTLDNVTTLNCENNQLVNLPSLPSIQTLTCGNNLRLFNDISHPDYW